MNSFIKGCPPREFPSGDMRSRSSSFKRDPRACLNSTARTFRTAWSNSRSWPLSFSQCNLRILLILPSPLNLPHHLPNNHPFPGNTASIAWSNIPVTQVPAAPSHQSVKPQPSFQSDRSQILTSLRKDSCFSLQLF